MTRTQKFSCLLLLPCVACGGSVETDTFSETSATTGPPDENSVLCAPVVEMSDTGETGEEPFPPEGESAVLYTCEGNVQVDINGRICLCGNGVKGDAKDCYSDIDVVPDEQSDETNVGVPSPIIVSSTDMPEPEIGACCLENAPNGDQQALNEALELVCTVDCGARACRAAAEELANIVADEACFWETFDPDNCHLSLGEGCVGSDVNQLCGLPLSGCRQARVLGATRSDILQVLALLETPAGFQNCQANIVDEEGWRPCLPAYLEPCQDWTLDNGRFVDLTITANCDEIAPVLFDEPNAPEPVQCNENQNANPGTAIPGEGFTGPLTGGSVLLSTPLGNKSVGVVGSSIGFRRLPCETDTCAFTLVDLDVSLDDVALGPFMVTGLHAELVAPATGLIRSDTTATLEDQTVYVRVTFGVGVKGNPFGLEPLHKNVGPILATNDGLVLMSIDDENNIEVLDAKFQFPSQIRARLATYSTSCAPE